MRTKASFKANNEKMKKEMDDLFQQCIENHRKNPIPTFGPLHSYSYASISLIAKYYRWRTVRRNKIGPNSTTKC